VILEQSRPPGLAERDARHRTDADADAGAEAGA
jgi:hypothetical protein